MALFEPHRSLESEEVVGSDAATRALSVTVVENDFVAHVYENLAWFYDLVFGPAEDGGFWLIGARRCPCLPPLFGAVRWSGQHALADVLANLPARVSVGFAARLADVDDGASLRRLAPRRGF